MQSAAVVRKHLLTLTADCKYKSFLDTFSRESRVKSQDLFRGKENTDDSFLLQFESQETQSQCVGHWYNNTVS